MLKNQNSDDSSISPREVDAKQTTESTCLVLRSRMSQAQQKLMYEGFKVFISLSLSLSVCVFLNSISVHTCALSIKTDKLIIDSVL